MELHLPVVWLSVCSLLGDSVESLFAPATYLSNIQGTPSSTSLFFPPLGIVFWRKSHSAFFGAWTAAAGRPVRRYLFHLVARPYFYGFASQRTLCCHSSSSGSSKSNKCCKWQQRLLSASNTMATCLSAPRRLFVSSFVLCSAWLGQQRSLSRFSSFNSSLASAGASVLSLLLLLAVTTLHASCYAFIISGTWHSGRFPVAHSG